MNELLSVSRGKAFNIKVFENRVTVEQGAWPLPKKTETIFIKTIASISERLGSLYIETTGNETKKYLIGPKAKQVKKLIEQLV